MEKLFFNDSDVGYTDPDFDNEKLEVDEPTDKSETMCKEKKEQ